LGVEVKKTGKSLQKERGKKRTFSNSPGGSSMLLVASSKKNKGRAGLKNRLHGGRKDV